MELAQLQGQADKGRWRQHLGVATLVGAGEQEALAGEHWLTFWDPDVEQTRQDKTAPGSRARIESDI